MKIKRVLSVFAFCLTLSIPSMAEDDSFRLETKSSNFAKGTVLNLVVEKGVSSLNSSVGNLFVARVAEPALAEDNKTVLIPRGSWVSGRVTKVQTPGRFSKAGKLSLELDYLTTLTGDVIPLNANISFETGKVNQEGVLDPQTGFKDKALAPTKKLLASDTGQIVSIATLGLPVVATLIGGSAYAVIAKGDNSGLLEGDLFRIELKDDSLLIKQ
jgi:hypothetical protein